MKILHFTHRGEPYQVNEKGEIKTPNSGEFSPTWVFIGGVRHHWGNHINVTLKMAFEDPKSLNHCLGVDCDHGFYRQWMGRYNGKLPRIENAYVTNE